MNITNTLSILRSLIDRYGIECEFNDDGNEIKVAELESKLPAALPADYRQFLILTNGESTSSEGICGGYRFLPTDEILDLVMEYRAELDHTWQNKTASAWYLGVTRFYEPNWVPIASLHPREHVMLSLGGQGNQGSFHVFEWAVDDGPGELYALGFDNFLQRVVDELIQDDGYIKNLFDLEVIFPPG